MLNDNMRTTVGQEELSGPLLPVAVTASGTVYLLSLAVFCVCGVLCGRCTLKHKECQCQHSSTAASCNTDRQVHSPPRYPAPIYEDTKLPLHVKAKIDEESPDSDSKHHQDDTILCKTEQQEIYSISPKHLAPIYEDVMPSAVCGHGAGRKKNVAEIELEMKENIAYGPV